MENISTDYCAMRMSVPYLNRLSGLGFEAIILNADSENCYYQIKPLIYEPGPDEKGFLIDTTC